MKFLTVALGSVLAQFILLGTLALAQVDPAKVLVGRWEGSVEVNRNQERALIINSVSQKDGGWVAEGRFAVPPRKGSVVTIDVSSQDGKLVLEFEAGGQMRNPWRLTLVGDNQLEGTANFVRGRGTVDRATTFKKVEQK
jgi:hypothetical protein